VDRTARFKTLAGGISIGSEEVTAGTLSGCFIDETDGSRVLVSNWHVFKGTPGETKVLQPGKYDGGGKNDVVGVVKRLVPVPPKGKLPWWKRIICFFLGWLLEEWCTAGEEPAKVDCACATFEPVDESRELVEGVYLDDGSIIHPKNSHPGDGILEKTVWKSGRTTGVTFGRVEADSAKVKVFYGDKWVIFEDVIVVRGLARPGDSGSPTFLATSDKPSEDDAFVGLLFAGSSEFFIVCKYKYIRPLLGVRWT